MNKDMESLVTFIDENISKNGYIEKNLIYKFGKENNILRSLVDELLEVLEKSKYLLLDKIPRTGKKKRSWVKVYKRTTNPVTCSDCMESGEGILRCSICQEGKCSVHRYQLGERFICLECIRNIEFCGHCLKRIYLVQRLVNDYDSMFEFITENATQLGFLEGEQENGYSCNNNLCEYSRKKIDLIENQRLNEWVEGYLDFDLFGGIEVNSSAEEEITLDIFCNNCNKIRKVILEKTEPIVTEEREMGYDESYTIETEGNCEECYEFFEIQLVYSIYASDSELIDWTVEGCFVTTPNFRFLNPE